MIRTFRYPLRSTVSQRSVLDLWLTRCRWLYNGALEERRSYYNKFGKGLCYLDQTEALIVGHT